MVYKVFWYVFFILLIPSVSVTAQKKEEKIGISGYVTDSLNNPVRGIRVMTDGKGTKSTTDRNGYYKITATDASEKITIIFPSGESITEMIAGRRIINFIVSKEIFEKGIVNSADNESIDIGYRKINSRKGALSVTRSDQIDVSGTEYSGYSNIYEMIQGKVPGVDVCVSCKSVRIRGINSLVSNNDPLFVVDGVPMNSIDFIHPDRVQSITLLKGTSAAIYGSRGVNGVIVITLKKTNQENRSSK